MLQAPATFLPSAFPLLGLDHTHPSHLALVSCPLPPRAPLRLAQLLRRLMLTPNTPSIPHHCHKQALPKCPCWPQPMCRSCPSHLPELLIMSACSTLPATAEGPPGPWPPNCPLAHISLGSPFSPQVHLQRPVPCMPAQVLCSCPARSWREVARRALKGCEHRRRLQRAARRDRWGSQGPGMRNRPRVR